MTVEEDPPVSFGKSASNRCCASELGEDVGALSAEFVVTEPSRERNGTATTSRTTQKTIG